MALTYYPEVFVTPLWDVEFLYESKGYPEVLQNNFNPYHWGERAAGRYINKVWDPVVNGWVRWTTNHIDYTGLEYPHPTNWVSVTQYAVERVIMENLG